MKEQSPLTPRYEVVEQLKSARKAQNVTQEVLAERVGTKKSNISRFESGRYNPSLDFRGLRCKPFNLSQMRGYHLFPVNASVYLGENFDRLFVVVACIVNDKGLKEFGGT